MGSPPLLSELDAWVSVDVETAGPNPSQYSLLAIGACLLGQPDSGFYAELQPVSSDARPEALEVSGLSMEALAASGTPPARAMADFAAWLESACPDAESPVFVGFNAAFDWMFVNDYFHRFIGRNPFGHSAVDMKSFFMGLTARPWDETTMAHVTEHYGGRRTLTHHALQDARDQALLFRRMLDEANDNRRRDR